MKAPRPLLLVLLLAGFGATGLYAANATDNPIRTETEVREAGRQAVAPKPARRRTRRSGRGAFMADRIETGKGGSVENLQFADGVAETRNLRGGQAALLALHADETRGPGRETDLPRPAAAALRAGRLIRLQHARSRAEPQCEMEKEGKRGLHGRTVVRC